MAVGNWWLSSGRWQEFSLCRFCIVFLFFDREVSFLLCCCHAQYHSGGCCFCICNLIMHLIKEMKFLLRLFAHSRRWHRAFAFMIFPALSSAVCVLFALFFFAFSFSCGVLFCFPPQLERVFPNPAVLFSHNFFECGLDLGSFTMRRVGVTPLSLSIIQLRNLHSNG